MNNQLRILGEIISSSETNHYLTIDNNLSKIDYVVPSISVGFFMVDPTEKYIVANQALLIQNFSSEEYDFSFGISHQSSGSTPSYSTRLSGERVFSKNTGTGYNKRLIELVI